MMSSGSANGNTQRWRSPKCVDRLVRAKHRQVERRVPNVIRPQATKRIVQQRLEAFRRFGDRDNCIVRASAAGLLAEMAQRQPRYFYSAFVQLFSGLMLERSSLTLDSIRTSVLDLTSTNPVKALKVLAVLNTTFSRAVSEAFIGFCAVHGAEAIERVPDKLWKEAEIITSFDQRTIKALFNTLPRGFYSRNYDRISRQFNALLAHTSIRLRLADHLANCQ
jgi:hypothetical protein